MMWLDRTLDMHIWIALGAILSGLFILVSYAYSSFQKDRIGATSEYAAIITYFIGVIAMMQMYSFAVMIAIGFLLLLSSKDYLN